MPTRSPCHTGGLLPTSLVQCTIPFRKIRSQGQARARARARGQGHDQGHARTRFPHLAICDAETRVPHRTCFCFSNIHECATRDLGPTSHGGRGRAEPGRASTCDAGLGPKPSDLRRGDQGPTSHVASFKHPGMCDAGPGSHIPWRAMPGRARTRDAGPGSHNQQCAIRRPGSHITRGKFPTSKNVRRGTGVPHRMARFFGYEITITT